MLRVTFHPWAVMLRVTDIDTSRFFFFFFFLKTLFLKKKKHQPPPPSHVLNPALQQPITATGAPDSALPQLLLPPRLRPPQGGPKSKQVTSPTNQSVRVPRTSGQMGGVYVFAAGVVKLRPLWS